MEPTISHSSFMTATESKSDTKSIAFWDKLEYNRWGVNMIILFVCMITGGLAGAFSLNMGTFIFPLILMACMATLITVLALVPMRVLVTVAVVNIIISVGIIAAGLITFGGLANP